MKEPASVDDAVSRVSYPGGWLVGVDIGGTFTDVVAVNTATGDTRHLKVSSSRHDPASAVVRGIETLGTEEGVSPGEMRLLLHGTTLVTNAIIERRLAPTALVTTEGFRDVLELGRTWRTELYDPFFEQQPPVVPRELRLEAAERLDATGAVVLPLTSEEVTRVVDEVRRAGVDAVAVAFLHSYVNAAHEDAITAALRREGDWFVCGSAELLRELREYERTATTVLNVALMPLVDDYLTRLQSGLADVGADVTLFISQSNGGAQTPALARERPVSLALSGPVAGVVALADIGRELGRGDLIGLDMGGTSTDVSIVSDFEPRYTTELTVGDLPVRLPSVRVNAIGAGGGSIAALDTDGGLKVGPRSAGSDPGPAAYGAGGADPTVTDAQLVLGRLSSGTALAGRLRLDRDLAADAISTEVAGPLQLDPAAAAAGIVSITNASMEGAVRVTLRDRGDDPRDFALVAYGGAGPLHACELARSLSIGTVIVPAHPGTLCAVGLLHSDVRIDHATSELHRSDEEDLDQVFDRIFDGLVTEARKRFEDDPHLDADALRFELSCDVRYLGQAYEVSVPVPEGALDRNTVEAVVRAFHERHARAYAFAEPDQPCEIVTFRAAAVAMLSAPASASGVGATTTEPVETRPVWELGAGYRDTPVYRRETLPVGHMLAGPALVEQRDATVWIPSYARAEVHESGSLLLTVSSR